PDTSLQGNYIFGDFISGNIYMAVLSDLDTPTVDTLMIIDNIGNIASFAEDSDGSLFALSLSGSIFRIGSAADSTGCDTLLAPELALLDNDGDSTALVTDSTFAQYVWFYSESSD